MLINNNNSNDNNKNSCGGGRMRHHLSWCMLVLVDMIRGVAPESENKGSKAILVGRQTGSENMF